MVLFGLFLLGFPSRFFKTCLLERGFHTLIKNASFSSLTDLGPPNPPLSSPAFLLAYHLVARVHPPFETQPSRRHIARCLALIPTCNGSSPPLANIIFFGLPLKVFKTRLVERGFHTLIKKYFVLLSHHLVSTPLRGSVWL